MADILFDNGFDTFFFVDTNESIFQNFDASFFITKPEARKRILEHLESKRDNCWGLELSVEVKSPLKGIYRLDLIETPGSEEVFFHLELEGFRIQFTRDVLPFLEGTELLINEDNELEARNPQMSITKLNGNIEEVGQQLLIDQVNPMVDAHGGVVSLQAVENTDIYLDFGGGLPIKTKNTKKRVVGDEGGERIVKR